MKLDAFTISRFLLIVFLVIIGIVFVIDNKSVMAVKEHYNDTVSPTVTPTPAPAPSTGQTNNLTNTSAPTVTVSPNPSNSTPSQTAPAINTNISNSDIIDRLSIPQVENSIKLIFRDLYNTEPTTGEISFYADYVTNRQTNMTVQQLKDIIATSLPTLQKTFKDSQATGYDYNSTFGTENTVISVFNEILQRNPDQSELYTYAKQMANEPQFTQDKLRQILISTDECKRLQQTQSNTVFNNLQGNITDQQLTLWVLKIYKDITGTDNLDNDTLKFLKKKFVEFSLNEATLIKFINAYIKDGFDVNSVKQQLNTSGSTAGSTGGSTAGSTGGSAAGSTSTGSSQNNNNNNTNTTEKFTSSSSVAGSTGQCVNINIYGNKDDAVVKDLLQKASKQDGSIDTTKLINSIKDNDACVYTKALAANNRQDLSDYIDERNRSLMGSICSRNKSYINADQNMVLYPEFKWSVPQEHPPVCVGGNAVYNPTVDQTSLIGTLLDDAKNTSVGSMLPLYPPA